MCYSRTSFLLLLHETVGVSWDWLTIPLPIIRVLFSIGIVLSLTMIITQGKTSKTENEKKAN